MGGVPGYAGQVPQAALIDRLGLGCGAPVYPNQAGADRPAIRTDGEAAVELAGDTQRADLVRGDARRGERLTDRWGERGLPQLGRLLGPARLRVVGLVRLGAAAKDTKVVRSDDDGLQTLGADIYTDDRDGPPPLEERLSTGRGKDVVKL
jgi:hypothetical protein